MQAANKQWLVNSSRSSQLSTDLHRYQLDVSQSLSMHSVEQQQQQHARHRGLAHDARPTSFHAREHIRFELPPTAPSAPPSETSWLLRHYNARKPRAPQHAAINTHLYDNISFADSPLLTRSLSQKAVGSDESATTLQSDDTAASWTACGGKFRLFLASYVLLGITLAVYSRSAISLAAIAMVASTEFSRQLVSIAESESNNATASLANYVLISDASLDGSCPVYRRQASVLTSPQLAAVGSDIQPILSSTAGVQQQQQQLESSIKQRVESGQLVNWTAGEQGLVFAGASLGNLLIAVPMTRLGEVYGPKWIIFTALFCASVQAALTPLVAPCHLALMFLFQVTLTGMTYGADCTAYTFFALWLTPTETAFFVACMILCYQVGAIMSNSFTTRVLSLGLSWAWCFYIPAVLCAVWTLGWLLIGANEPSVSAFLSPKEKSYLSRKSKIAQLCNDNEESTNSTTKATSNIIKRDIEHCAHSVSWLKLASDPNIWAIIAVKFTLRWYFSVYASLMPTYLATVAHMSVATIGTMSVCQAVIALVSGLALSYLTRSVVVKRPFNLTLATFRKSFQSIVNFGLAASLLVFTLFDCNQIVTISALTVAGICINFYVAAALQLPLDLSPDHCGLITSITNTLALGQVLGSPLSGLILDAGPKERARWRLVWLLAILLNVLSGLLFILLVDSKPKDYNKYSSEHELERRASSPPPSDAERTHHQRRD